MPWLDDIVTVLEDASVGTHGTDLFTTTKSQVPKLAAGCVRIIDTGGSGAEHTHNSTDAPAWRNPSAQIMVSADTSDAAIAKAQAAHDALMVRNRMINGNKYRRIDPLTEIRDMGIDDRGQVRYGFNVTGTYNKRS